MSMFVRAPCLEGPSLSLRPLVQSDYEGLFLCGGDKRVWSGHPDPMRYKKNNFDLWFADAQNCGAALTVLSKINNEIIGSTRFYFEGTPDDAVSIGYTFLAYKCWGGTVNKELKTIMLNYAFKTFPSVWFHISPANIRSQCAVVKIGANYVKDEEVALSDGEPLVWKFYRIDKLDWQRSSS